MPFAKKDSDVGAALPLGLTDRTTAPDGAASPKEMGKVMAALKERYAGRMDFGKASGLVKELLK